jgi:hypothetical protein
MPNLTNVEAEQDGRTMRVRGSKGSSVTVRVYLNPDLALYPTDQDLYDAYGRTGTPAAEDSSTERSFDLSVSLDGVAPPYEG